MEQQKEQMRDKYGVIISDLETFNKQIVQRPKTQEYLTQVLGEKKQEFVNNLTALVAGDTALQECEPVTIMYAAIKATALDLPLDKNLGFSYVIPYNNKSKNIKEAQFQMGYKGYIQLAMRSGQFKTINVRDVRAGELVDEDFVSGEMRFKKLDTDREKAEIIGYVAFFRLINGFEKMSYWTKEEVQSHAMRYSETYKSKHDYIQANSKWTTDFDAMAKKTVLKLLLSKYAPLSVQMQSAIKYDQAVIDKDGNANYVDNTQAIEVDVPTEEGKKAASKFSDAIDSNVIEAEIETFEMSGK